MISANPSTCHPTNLIDVIPGAFVREAQESVRIAPACVEITHGPGGDELVPRLSLVVAVADFRERGETHVDLRFEIRARAHRPAAGNEARVRIALLQHRLEAADHSAE